MAETASIPPDAVPAEDDGQVEQALASEVKEGTKQSDILVRYADDADLWHDPDGIGYATITVGGHRENYRIRTNLFRDWLCRAYYKQQKGAPRSQALEDALRVVEAKARYDGPEYEPALRLAEYGGAIYLDLGDREWRAVKVDATGWEIVTDPPVKFIRPRNMRALPAPESGGSIDDLREFVNVASEDDFVLLVAVLLAAFRPGRPFPILILNGEQGTAKSTGARVLRRLIDPNKSEIRSVPKEQRDLAAAARNSWIVCYDNISAVPDWLSDSLCRLATGGGLGGRELYTDHDEAVFEAIRPVILNGIPALATKADLVDRAVPLTLKRIKEQDRLPETIFWARFAEVHGRILGALLGAVSTALRRLPEVNIQLLPRMADFALWATAAEPSCGWPDGTFMRAYRRNQAAAIETAVESDSVAVALLKFLHEVGEWSGTATELLDALNERVPDDKKRERDWPKDATRMSSRLRAAAPGLRAKGIEVDDEPQRLGRSSKKIWNLRTVGENSDRSDRSDRTVENKGFFAVAEPATSDRTSDRAGADVPSSVAEHPVSDRANPLKNKAAVAAVATVAESRPCSPSAWETDL